MSFEDVLAANEAHAAAFDAVPAGAARRLAVVTCMDPRVDPLPALGLRAGDAAVLRNPGGRVDDDVRRGLALARDVLGVERVMVIRHTDCRAVAAEELEATVAEDLAAVDGFEAAGFVYDVETGRLRRIC